MYIKEEELVAEGQEIIPLISYFLFGVSHPSPLISSSFEGSLAVYTLAPIFTWSPPRGQTRCLHEGISDPFLSATCSRSYFLLYTFLYPLGKLPT